MDLLVENQLVVLVVFGWGLRLRFLRRRGAPQALISLLLRLDGAGVTNARNSLQPDLIWLLVFALLWFAATARHIPAQLLREGILDSALHIGVDAVLTAGLPLLALRRY